jgi:hypothetical protein
MAHHINQQPLAALGSRFALDKNEHGLEPGVDQIKLKTEIGTGTLHGEHFIELANLVFKFANILRFESTARVKQVQHKQTRGMPHRANSIGVSVRDIALQEKRWPNKVERGVLGV